MSSPRLCKEKIDWVNQLDNKTGVEERRLGVFLRLEWAIEGKAYSWTVI